MSPIRSRCAHRIVVAVVSVLLNASSVIAAAAEIRVAGSDLLGLDFSKTVYEFAQRNQLHVTLALDGSRPGAEALKNGRADLALLVLPESEQPGGSDLGSFTVAYHRVVVCVPAACPVEQVSLEQLAGLFGAGGSTNVTRWGELGATGAWASSAIVAVAPRIGDGIALEYFRHAALGGRELKPNLVRYSAADELVRLMSGESRVVVIGGALPLPAARAKVLAVAPTAGGVAFLPSAENLHAGDYPLRLPLRVFFRREAATVLAPLLRFLAGDEAAPHFERAGVVPLPPAARAQQAAALLKK